MHRVVVSERLALPAAAVWAAMVDVRSYPRRMPSVRAIDVLSESSSVDGTVDAVVAWDVELDGSLLRWIQRERRCPATHEVHFEQISGDLRLFRGAWRLEPSDAGCTEATLEVEFDLGIPMLREVLEPFAVEAIRDNSVQMLRGLAGG